MKYQRVDQVGSLLRLESLKTAFLKYGNGEISFEELESLQNKAISEIVRKQDQLGFPVISDGEFRRLNWQGSFSEVDGWNLLKNSWRGFVANPSLVGEAEKPNTRGMDAVESFKIPAIAKLELLRNFPLSEYQFLSAQTERPCKSMLMGPDRVSQMCEGVG